VIVAVHGDKCTVSAINKTANAVVVAANGIATLTHTPITGPTDYSYPAIDAVLVNLGQTDMIGQIKYSVVEATHTLTTQSLFPTFGPVNPASADVINLKAQYGLDTDDDGIVDTWQDPTGAVWSAETLPAILPSTLALKTWQQIRAVRVAIVTRSPQYEKDVVTDGPLSILNGTVSMPLTADQQHYRYKILETIVPLRNALWNAS
jgi:type IV pilus assembly protein PilW